MKTQSVKINAMLNVIKTCSTIIFPLITYPYVLRILMPENIGRVNFSNSFVSYFSLIAGLGISTYAIRECAKSRGNQNNLDRISSQIFSINIITTLVAYLFLLLSLLVFYKLRTYRTLILLYSVTILFTTLGADWINTAMEDFLYITIRTVLFQLLHIVLIFAFIKNSDDYVKYAAISVLTASGANILNIFYRRKYCNMRIVFKIEWRRHLAPIFFMFVMILSQTIFNTADITMLGFMKGDYSVGIYSTAVKISHIISQLVSSILFVLLPKLSSLFSSDDYDRINSMLRKVLGFIIITGLPCYVGVTVLSDEIMMIIGGAAYIESPTILRILLVSFLFSLVGGSFLGNIVLLPSGNEKKYMIICCITAGFNVITNYLFIPRFGVFAAAGTTAASSLLILVLLILTIDKRIKIASKLRLFLSPILGSIVLGILCLLIKKNIMNLYIRFAVCVSVGLIAYSGVLLIFKNEFFMEIMQSIKTKVLRLKNEK